jgi:hypothetical protein
VHLLDLEQRCEAERCTATHTCSELSIECDTVNHEVKRVGTNIVEVR